MLQNRIEAHVEGARGVRRVSPTSTEVFTEGTLGLRANGGTPALEQHGTGTGPPAARAGRPRAGAAGRRHGGARPRPAAEGAPAGPPLRTLTQEQQSQREELTGSLPPAAGRPIKGQRKRLHSP